MPGKFLPEFELYVLLAVAQLGEEAYGVAVRRRIESLTARPVSVGALYTTLARLENKGLLSQKDSALKPAGRGRPRRLCLVTTEGRDAVQHSLEMLGRMAAGVDFAPPLGTSAK